MAARDLRELTPSTFGSPICRGMAGSIALAGSIPSTDDFRKKRIRAAGAIVLAKSNLSEFTARGDETVSSRLAGYTKNPYALDRVTAGSSGGAAAAVSANFGAVGLGSDTENPHAGPLRTPA
jgi:amidase